MMTDTDSIESKALLTQSELHDPESYLARYRAQLRKAEAEDPSLPQPIAVRNINRVLSYRSLSKEQFEKVIEISEYVIKEVKARSAPYDRWIKQYITEESIMKVVATKDLGFLAAMAWLVGTDAGPTIRSFITGFTREGHLTRSMPFWADENRPSKRDPKHDPDEAVPLPILYDRTRRQLAKRAPPLWQGPELMDAAYGKAMEQVEAKFLHPLEHHQVHTDRIAYAHDVKTVKNGVDKHRLVEDDSYRSMMSQQDRRMAMANPAIMMDTAAAILATPQPGAIHNVLYCSANPAPRQQLKQIMHEVKNKEHDYHGYTPQALPALRKNRSTYFFHRVLTKGRDWLDKRICTAVEVPRTSADGPTKPLGKSDYEKSAVGQGTALVDVDETALRTEPRVAGALVDLANAYKQLPAKDASKNIVAVYNRSRQIWETFFSSSILFGNGHSAASFQTFSELLCTILFLPYIDDLTALVFLSDVEAVHRVMNSFMKAAGVDVSVKANGNFWDSTFLSLGITYTCVENLISVMPDASTIQKAVAVIKQILDWPCQSVPPRLSPYGPQRPGSTDAPSTLPVNLVEKMTGSLLHILMATRSSVIMTPLHQLYNTITDTHRAYDADHERAGPRRANHRMVPMALVPLVQAIARIMLQTVTTLVPYNITPPMARLRAHVYSDASVASAGAVLFTNTHTLAFTYYFAPQDRHYAINLKEAFAIYLAAASFAPYIKGTAATFYIDNVAALSYTKSRKVKNYNLAVVSAYAQQKLQEHDVIAAFKYVRTLANVSDAMTTGGHRLSPQRLISQFHLTRITPVATTISELILMRQ